MNLFNILRKNIRKNNVVIYTAIFGDYDDLKEPPKKLARNCDFICFTNNKKLKSLKNCPNYILNKHMFDIEGCSNLDSLEGCPKEVCGDFYCSNCKRKFTIEEVMSLCEAKRNIIV